MPVKETANKPPWELPEQAAVTRPRDPLLDRSRRRPQGELSTSYADIEPEESYSVWTGKLPLREVVLGAGEGGIGKGLWLADIVARITNGEDMPDGSESDLGGPKNVVLVTPEDHIRRAMAWRLRAAGADLERVFDLTKVLGADFTIPDHIELLAAEVQAIGDVALVGLDPLSQLCDKNLTSVKFVRRSIFAPLRDMAENLNLCAYAMHHLTKAGSVAGSAALVQAVRMLLRFDLHEMDPGLVVLSTGKTNNTAKGPDLYYGLVGDGHDVCVEYRELDIEPVADATAGENMILYRLKKNAGAMGPKELAALTGMTPGSVRVLLSRMAKAELVRREGIGKYVAA